jgi:hypothetical protein
MANVTDVLLRSQAIYKKYACYWGAGLAAVGNSVVAVGLVCCALSTEGGAV